MIAARILSFVLAVAVALAVASPRPAAAQEPGAFLSVIEDIPLMPGLTEDEASAVVFDAAQGRLAETLALGTTGRAAILAFYGETLPALGWLADGDARWVRDGEALTIEFEDAPAGKGSAGTKGAGDIAVRFSLSPVGPR